MHEYKNSKPTINPIKEIICIYSIFKILRSVNPDLLHLITLKPYIYGGLINRFYLKKSIVISVAGLGLLISNESKSVFLKSVIIFLMKMSFKNSHLKIITQNDQDTDFLVVNKICLIEKIKLIRGSGVNLNKYQPIKHNIIILKGIKILLYSSCLIAPNAFSLQLNPLNVFISISKFFNSLIQLIKPNELTCCIFR